MDALREWFAGLAPRERLLVSVAAGLSVFAVLVIGVVRPILGQADAGADRVARKESLLADIERVAARGPQRTAGAAAPGAGSGQSLVLLVDRTTRSRGLAAYLKRNQPDGEDAIRLRFENAPFDTLVGWLGELETVYGLAATSADIDAGGEAGRVNCNLVLGRAAG